MTSSKTIEFWRCTYCKREFDTYREAWDCATDCADVECPEQGERVEYKCDGCAKTFDEEWHAEDCEKQHLNDETDPFHDKTRIIIGRKRLAEAADHPAQTRIFEQAVTA